MNFLDDNILNVYHYGSFVYDTFKENISDYDFIVIIKDNYYPIIDNKKIDNFDEPINIKQINFDKTYKNCQIKFFFESNWKEMIDENAIETLEIFWIDKKYILKETKKFEFSINYGKIRENISKTASNSFVKCKKKLELTNEYRIGKKSLWHSIRLLMFGNQIMKYGYIKDYSEANIYYEDIVNNNNNDWNYYKKTYQPIYNYLKSQFKINHNNANQKFIKNTHEN